MKIQNTRLRSNKKKKGPRRKSYKQTDQAKQGYYPLAIQPSALPLSPRDDLLMLEGVDPEIEMALNGIGIHQFSDFRRYTPQSLSQILQKRAGVSVSASMIESLHWFEEAETLAEESPLQFSPPLEQKKREAIEGNQSFDNDSQTEKREGKNLLIASEVGHEHINKKSPKEIEQQEDENLKLSTLEETSQLVSETAPAEVKKEFSPNLGEQKNEQQTATELQQRAPVPEPKNDIDLRIKSAQFVQFDRPGAADEPSEKMLSGEIQIELAGTEVLAALTEKISICTQIHAFDTVSGETDLLASKAKHLQLDRAEHCIQIEFKVPKVGRYQLQIIAFVLEADPKIDFYQGPILRVEE